MIFIFTEVFDFLKYLLKFPGLNSLQPSTSWSTSRSWTVKTPKTSNSLNAQVKFLKPLFRNYGCCTVKHSVLRNSSELASFTVLVSIHDDHIIGPGPRTRHPVRLLLFMGLQGSLMDLNICLWTILCLHIIQENFCISFK